MNSGFIKKIHIVFVLPEFVTEKDAGGLATYYDNISRLLADDGNIVTIFVLSDLDASIDYYPNVTVKRVLIDKSEADPGIPSSFMRLWSREINRRVKEFKNAGNKIDIIQYANYMGLGVNRLIDVPTVVRISSFQPLMRAASKLVFDINKEYINEHAADYLETLSVIKADAVYSPSKLMTIPFGRETGRMIRVIESPFYPVSSYSIAENKMLKGKKYIITFSTLNLLKGIKLIGDCIWDILSENKEIYWAFAGVEVAWTDEFGVQTSPSEYISKKAGEFANRLIFLGKIEHAQLMRIVDDAEVCVMPSRIDNLPNTCIEAMALGKVVVGTKGASFEQLIDDGENGFLIERESGADLISKVNRALRLDSIERKQMGKNAKKRINEMEPTLIKERLMDLYEGTIAGFLGSPTYRTNENYDRIRLAYNELMEHYGTSGECYRL